MFTTFYLYPIRPDGRNTFAKWAIFLDILRNGLSNGVENSESDAIVCLSTGTLALLNTCASLNKSPNGNKPKLYRGVVRREVRSDGRTDR